MGGTGGEADFSRPPPASMTYLCPLRLKLATGTVLMESDRLIP